MNEVTSLAQIQDWVRRGALYAGSDEPEDMAQEVLCRVYASGRTPELIPADNPFHFWLAAGRREAIRHWRLRHQIGDHRQPYACQVPLDEARDRSGYWNTEAQALDRVILGLIPARIVVLTQVRYLTGRERTELCRWRLDAYRGGKSGRFRG